MRRVFPLLLAACLLPVLVFADLHDPNNAADYMIVTTQQLINDYPWINQLAQWRNDHGRTAMVVPTESIWAEFGTDVPSDTVLKTFLFYARENWQAPQLKDVFIIGYFNVVPTHTYHDSIGPGSPLDIPSDFYYVIAEADSLPLFNIGRLPWNPVQSPSLYNYFAKVQSYESAAADTWQTRIHLIADSSGGTEWGWAHVFETAIVPSIHSGYDIVRDYGTYPVGDPWHGNRATVLEHLNLGNFFVMYYGYGGGHHWSDVWMIDSTDFGSLTNYPQLPIVIATAWDAGPDSITEVPHALLANAQGGAVGYIGNTSVEWAATGASYRRFLARYATSDTAQVLGDVMRLTDSVFVTWNWPMFESARHIVRGRLLFGDPGLVLPPRPTAVGDFPESLPQSIRLLGNYPNPFNAVTEIRFELNRTMPVSLKVHDVLGRETATLVNGMTEAGSHAVTWNAQAASSGVYFAVLQAGDARQVRKMMMLK